MRAMLTSLVIIAFSVSLSAQEEKKYESKAGKYLAAFPGAPTITTSKAGAVEMNIASVEKGSGGYLIIYSDLPADVVKLAKPKELLDGGEKGLVDSFKAKIISSKDVEYGKQKFPARQIVAEKDTINVRITIILAENRLYQVFVVGPKELVSGKDADKFLESFEVTR